MGIIDQYNASIKKAKALIAPNDPMSDADAYRRALERAAYGDAGSEYGAGLGQVTNFLAGAGPLSDSGAATALKARLYSQVYGRARGRVQQGYADYLGQSLAAQQRYKYQLALQEAAKKKKRLGDYIGGAIGGVVGAISPFGGGGGGSAPSYQANDAYYG